MAGTEPLSAGRHAPELGFGQKWAVDARQRARRTGAFSADADAAARHVLDGPDEALRRHELPLDLETPPDHRLRPAVDENQVPDLASGNSGERFSDEIRSVAVVPQAAV